MVAMFAVFLLINSTSYGLRTYACGVDRPRRFPMPGYIGSSVTKPKAEENFHTAPMLQFYIPQKYYHNRSCVFFIICHKALLRDRKVSDARVGSPSVELIWAVA
jgi:hypothetical protein